MKRRTFLLGAGAAVAAAASGVSGAAQASQSDGAVALIYRGPASLPGCPEAAARLLQAVPTPYRAVFCGPDERVQLSAESLASAALYVQPGGGTLASAWKHMAPHANTLRRWVHGGGHYVGLCLGGYLAGASPGFGLLPGDAGRYIASSGASVRTTGDTLVEVTWRERNRIMFFQDGPAFTLDDGARAQVLARYPNRDIAALVAEVGQGRVAVVGPHPEADPTWYGSGLSNPEGFHFDLGRDLFESVL